MRNNSTDELYGTLFILQVMTRQIARSGYDRYFVLKGGTALLSMLRENNQDTYLRATQDIDLHVCSSDVWVQFKNNILGILNSNEYGISFSVISFKNRSLTSDSILLQASYQGNTYKLKIDMNVSPFNSISVCFLSTTGMNAYDCETMLADKISAVCSEKIFRRVKDVYDIYVLSQVGTYSYANIVNHIRAKRPEFFNNRVWMFHPQYYDALNHAYDKYKGIYNKPDFKVIFEICSCFVSPFVCYNVSRDLFWNGVRWV